MAARRPTPRPDPNTAERIAALTRLSDGALADIDITGEDRPGLSLLLAVADEVSARAGALIGIEGSAWEMTDLTAGWITPPTGSTLTAKAGLLARLVDHCVWQISFAEPDGTVVAHAVLKRRPHPTEVVPAAALPSAASDLRAAQPAERQRDHIAEAAAAVIAAKGFAHATVREIAEAAGMHVPTLYTHIASKHDLLELVYTWSMDRILVDVGQATANCRSAREKVAAIMAAMIARADENKRLVGVLNRELRSLPHGARERVLDRYRVILHELAKVIAEGVAAGEFRPVDPAVVANIIDAACDMRALRPFSFDAMALAEFERHILAFIDAGLRGP